MQGQVAMPVSSRIELPEYHLLEAEWQTPLKQPTLNFSFLSAFFELGYFEPEQAQKVWRVPNWAFAYKND